MEPTAVGVELADTSVWARNGKPGLECRGLALEDGKIAVCEMVAMELLRRASLTRRLAGSFRSTNSDH